ncbi:GlxA family transcriptional regulator [Phytomonospora endophytica]|uniref:Transcriptional regulator GlxA family with amidase domain n=1 Tax=Phytomonospora endophytica TaxID=714109 RepID=A0A841G5M8_9ACTN|nr:helix-turn-helix domain-containing protein [Phytomonospora endophytica]MBB6039400.1 transcriptional regulator GlxA family with amidase domain [Phytomonospora endophytica]GIG70127.1 AraC family transcriptional regulator [Phytomonospora endophytica]
MAVVLFDGTPLFEDSVPIRVFGALRADVRVVAHHGGPSITTADGLSVSTPGALDDITGADIVVVPSYGVPADVPPGREILDAVRHAHDEGAEIVGLCLGAFVVAATGLLDGRAATTHWHQADLLARLHPTVDVRLDSLYVQEDRVLTSAGSAAGLDACLHLVRRRHGDAAATRVARHLVVAPHRDGGQAQYVEHPIPKPGGDPIGRVLAHLLTSLAVDHNVDALAERARMSRRSFDRHFRAGTGTTPAQWIRHQRLLAAQRLLEETDLPVEAVARRCGYPSAAALRPHFTGEFGVPPAAYRRTFRVPLG